jgi:hypothetical protein
MLYRYRVLINVLHCNRDVTMFALSHRWPIPQVALGVPPSGVLARR